MASLSVSVFSPSDSIPFESPDSPSLQASENIQEKVEQIFQGHSPGEITEDDDRGSPKLKHLGIKLTKGGYENAIFEHADLPDKLMKYTHSSPGERTNYPDIDCSFEPVRLIFKGRRSPFVRDRVVMAQRARIAKQKNNLDLIWIANKVMAYPIKSSVKGVAVVDKFDLDTAAYFRLKALTGPQAFRLFKQVFTLVKETGLVDVSFLDGNISFLRDREGVAFIDTESWGIASLKYEKAVEMLGGARSGELAVARTIIARLSKEVDPYLNVVSRLAKDSAYQIIYERATLEIDSNMRKINFKIYPEELKDWKMPRLLTHEKVFEGLRNEEADGRTASSTTRGRERSLIAMGIAVVCAVALSYCLADWMRLF